MIFGQQPHGHRGKAMRKCLIFIVCFLSLSMGANAADTQLVQMAQQELMALGYDPGTTDGEMNTKTTIAISKFQAEQGMEVTGEASPQLVGALRAAGKQQNQPVTAQAADVTGAPEMDLQARQQACLQEKYAAAQEANKKKRGFGRLLNAAARVTGRFGGPVASRTVYDVYTANATAADINAAAKDLGLSDDEVEQCRNPS